MGILSAVLSALGGVPQAAERLPGEIANGARAAGSGLAALGQRNASPTPTYSIDPTTGQMASTAAAPSPMWHNLLKGALLGIAAGVSPRGTMAYQAERQQQDQQGRKQAQQEFQDQMAVQQANNEKLLNAARMHQMDLENAKNSLWLQDEPAEHLSALRSASAQHAEALEKSGHENVGHISSESELGAFRAAHPDLAKKFVAGDIHTVPTFDDTGKANGFDVYEQKAPAGTNAPIGKPTAVKMADGRTVTLPPETTFAQLNTITGSVARDTGAKAAADLQARLYNKQFGPPDTATMVGIAARKAAALRALESGVSSGKIAITPEDLRQQKQNIQNAYEQELSTAVHHDVPHFEYPPIPSGAPNPATTTGNKPKMVHVRLANGMTGMMSEAQAKATAGAVIIP